MPSGGALLFYSGGSATVTGLHFLPKAQLGKSCGISSPASLYKDRTLPNSCNILIPSKKCAIQYICPLECLKICRSCLLPRLVGPGAMHNRRPRSTGSPSIVHTKQVSMTAPKCWQSSAGQSRHSCCACQLSQDI